MTSHELAKKLLDGPDLPVTYTDWDQSLHGDTPDIVIESVEKEKGKRVEFGGTVVSGSHINLS